MFERKRKTPDGPLLIDRIVESGCRRIAILGLHPRAGARTVLEALVGQVHRREMPLAVTSVPRLPPEAEIIISDPVTRVPLPAGAVLATASGTEGAAAAAMERIAATEWSTTLGPIGLYRVTQDAEVDLYGPDEAAALTEITARLEELSGGIVLVDGAWERRAFAAPGVTDGVVIVCASGYSATPERSAAAARYHVECLSAPTCSPAHAVAFEKAASRSVTVLLDTSGAEVGIIPAGIDDPMTVVRALDGAQVATMLLPHGLNDDFMIPLVRTTFRCTLVVRDATRVGLAPIYFQGWLKGEGRIEVVRPVRLIAAATNPVNPCGPDADPEEFRVAVAAQLPGVPVHDVLLESEEGARRPAWKFWG